MKQNAFELAKAFGYLSHSEVVGIKAIATILPEGAVCVNLGAGSGTSSLAVCEDRPDLLATFHTIDISPSGPLGGLENERIAFKLGYIDGHPIQLLGDTIGFGKSWPKDKKIDYLFIDDDHSAEHLQEEIDVWLPLLADNAIVAFHDYGSVNWSGVKGVVDKMMVEHPELKPWYLVRTLFVFKKGEIYTKEPHAPTS